MFIICSIYIEIIGNNHLLVFFMLKIFSVSHCCLMGLCLWLNLPVQETPVWSLGKNDPWTRKWKPTLLFLPGKSHGQRSLAVFSSVTQLFPTLCDPVDCSTSGLPVHHQLSKFTQIHVHWVSHAIKPSHPLSPPSPLAFDLSQHQGLFQWVSSSHEVAKVLEF